MEAEPVAGNVNLKAADAEAVCATCHGDRGDALPCRHSSEIPAGNMAISDSLRASLKNGKVVCTTCHDIVFQCERPKLHFSWQNKGFLRDRSSHEPSSYCSKCHDEAGYAKLNPHDGVAGTPPKPTCLLCHESLPEASPTGDLTVRFNMRNNLNDTCLGCHDVSPHPKPMIIYSPEQTSEWIHLVEPSDEVLSKMRQTIEQKGVALPLNPLNGEVFCGTCHNQHGFQPSEQQSRSRLRMDNICQACHER